MIVSVNRAVKACVIFTLTCLAAPVFAQGSDTPPPVRELIDENGVNLATAKHKGERTDIAIGPLAFVRAYGFGIGGHSYDLGIFTSGSLWLASTGLGSIPFTLSGSTYTAADGSGATLVKSGSTYTLTTGEGVVIVYNYTTLGTGEVNRKARGTSITYPTGDKITLAWVDEEYCSNFSDGCESGVWRTAVRLQAVSSALGYQLHFNYGRSNIPSASYAAAWHRLDSVTALNTAVDYCDPFAHNCTYSETWPTVSYSGNQVTDALGRTSEFVTNVGALTYTIRRPSSSSSNVTYNLDSNARVTSVVRDGLTTTYSYSVSGTTATMTRADPLSHQRVIISDLNVGLPTSVQDELGRTASFQYDSSGRLSRITSPEGNYVSHTYDSRGNLTQTQATAKSGSGLSAITTSATFPSSCTNVVTCNKPSSTTDARGNVTDYTYDSTHGGVLTVTAPAPTTGAVRPQTRYTYSSLQAYYKNSAGSIVASGLPVYRVTVVSACQTTSSCSGGADEAKTTIAYGLTGVANNLFPTSSSSGAGNGSLTATVDLTYDNFGQRLTVDGPLSGTADTTRYRFDADSQLVGEIGPDPDGAGALKHRARRITYNLDGQVTKVELGTVNSQSDTDWAAFTVLQAVETSYDTSARPVTRKLTSGGTTYALMQTSYDGKGRPECTAQRMNPAIYGSLPGSACTLGTQGSFGPDRIVKSIYDAADQVTQSRSALGTSDETDEVTTTFSNNGKVSTVTDGEGNKSTFEYDGHDRLLKTRFPDTTKGAGSSSTTDYEQLTYDAGFNITNHRLRDGTSIGFTYDALNRVTAKNLPGSEPDVSYTYDALSRLTGASQTGNALTFGYDAFGRLLTQTGPHGTVTSTWDLGGRRTRITYPDTFYVDQDYLVTGEMTKVRENGATSSVGVLATYAYDDLGRRTSLTRGNGSVVSYSFDSVSRLSQIVDNLSGTSHDQTLGFSYDPAARITQATRSNDLYAWTGHYNVARNYTSNGRNEYSSIGSLPITPTYDNRRNLTSAGTLTSGQTYAYSSENLLTSASGGITLAYDPLLRLYQTVSSPGTTRLAYDGANLISEYDGSNALLRRYVHGPETDEPLVWYEGSGTTNRRFLHADERGSIVGLTDSSGSIIATNAYDEYGIPQNSNFGRFQYTGQTWLSDLSLYYYKARIYSPTLGRFMQTDPIGYADGMNLYAYAGADPTNGVDPTGMSSGGEGRHQIWTGTRIPYADYDGGICKACSGFSSRGMGPNRAAMSRDTTPWTLSATAWLNPDGSVAFLSNITVTLEGSFNGMTLSGSAVSSVLSAPSSLFILAAGPGLTNPYVTVRPIDQVVFAHIAARHFGAAANASVFRPEWRDMLKLNLLLVHAVQTVVPQPSYLQSLVYTTTYKDPIGWERGTGNLTYNYTAVVRFTGQHDQLGKRIMRPVTMHPGLPY